jgi:hypothetical protein
MLEYIYIKYFMHYIYATTCQFTAQDYKYRERLHLSWYCMYNSRSEGLEHDNLTFLVSECVVQCFSLCHFWISAKRSLLEKTRFCGSAYKRDHRLVLRVVNRAVPHCSSSEDAGGSILGLLRLCSMLLFDELDDSTESCSSTRLLPPGGSIFLGTLLLPSW